MTKTQSIDHIQALERVRKHKAEQIAHYTGLILSCTYGRTEHGGVSEANHERATQLRREREKLHEELAAIDVALDLMLKARI